MMPSERSGEDAAESRFEVLEEETHYPPSHPKAAAVKKEEEEEEIEEEEETLEAKLDKLMLDEDEKNVKNASKAKELGNECVFLFEDIYIYMSRRAGCRMWMLYHHFETADPDGALLVLCVAQSVCERQLLGCDRLLYNCAETVSSGARVRVQPSTLNALTGCVDAV